MLDKAAYTIAELVKIGPIGRSSIYKAIGEFKLVARKCGRRTVVLATDYEQFLRNLPTIAKGADIDR